MRRSLPQITCRVSDTLIARGHHGLIVTAPESATGPVETAEALEVELAALVHSQVFLLGDDPILLLVSAVHRVDTERTGARLDGPLIPAPPHLVVRYTGQLPGSIAPVGHPANLPTWVDSGLSGHRELWAAGGSPGTVFRTSYQELLRITAGLSLDLD
ncbi:YbaK/EbsC family protein [Nocardia jinanensis]|uniref:YbaK/EbsC family protein n=1 Tax=Nocardia jinanensis TaxID=382504 RepID=UPI000738755D|nr:YbaK/EbsC family protein [Nocardia jinanensis]